VAAAAFDGCCYLLRPDLLAARARPAVGLSAELPPWPRFVAFDLLPGGGASWRWATPAELTVREKDPIYGCQIGPKCSTFLVESEARGARERGRALFKGSYLSPPNSAQES
jgi:hypothetical protein